MALPPDTSKQRDTSLSAVLFLPMNENVFVTLPSQEVRDNADVIAAILSLEIAVAIVNVPSMNPTFDEAEYFATKDAEDMLDAAVKEAVA